MKRALLFVLVLSIVPRAPVVRPDAVPRGLCRVSSFFCRVWPNL